MKALNSLAKLDRDNRQNKPHSKMEMREEEETRRSLVGGVYYVADIFLCVRYKVMVEGGRA